MWSTTINIIREGIYPGTYIARAVVRAWCCYGMAVLVLPWAKRVVIAIAGTTNSDDVVLSLLLLLCFGHLLFCSINDAILLFY